MVTLDDLGQALYTSGHAIHSNNLDEVNEEDWHLLEKDSLDNNNYVGYLSHVSEFPLRLKKFLTQAENINFSNVIENGLTLDRNELQHLEKIHENPLEALDEQSIFFLAPVSESAQMLSTFPNGYFSSDLDPFENFVLSKYLSDNFQYELFGIGASLIAFVRDEPLNAQQLAKLTDCLSQFYHISDEDLVRRLKTIMEGKAYLFLKYVEYLDF